MLIAWLALGAGVAHAAPGICPEGFLLDEVDTCVRWVRLSSVPEAVRSVVVNDEGVFLIGESRTWRHSVDGSWVEAASPVRRSRGRRVRVPRRARTSRWFEEAPLARTDHGVVAFDGYTVWRLHGGTWARSVPCPVRAQQVAAHRGLVVVVGDTEVAALEQASSGAAPWAPMQDWSELEADAERATGMRVRAAPD